MTAIKGIVAFFLATLAPLVAADTVYKYQRPDGKVVYSDSPVKGAKLIGQFELVPVPPAPTARGEPPRSSAATDDGVDSRARALKAADARIKAADQALKDAQELQQRAVEPLPGERQGNTGGATSRLNAEYFSRQRAAEEELDAARSELDEAYRARNALRE